MVRTVIYAGTVTWLVVSNVGLVTSAWACDPHRAVQKATRAQIRRFFQAQGKTVITFLGYSAAGYENRAEMLEHAKAILEQFDPKSAIINIGATPDGIGAVYELAKNKGFTTTGIVSTQAREADIPLSPCVDYVFFVHDSTWGGFLEGQPTQLSPTSAAMVDVSNRIVAIGGGEVTRDELIAAKRAGKDASFIPADMNHAIARERARRQGEPEPTDFRGAAGTALGTARGGG